jgi:small subunit ribosomal protein S6
MNKYRLTVIFSTKLEDKVREKEKEKLVKLVEELGGKILKQDEWGVRELKYEIKKETQGDYLNLEIELSGEKVVELEKALGINEAVLRRLIVMI